MGKICEDGDGRGLYMSLMLKNRIEKKKKQELEDNNYEMFIDVLKKENDDLKAKAARLQELVDIMECYVPCWNCDAIGWKCERCLVEDDLNRLRKLGWL